MKRNVTGKWAKAMLLCMSLAMTSRLFAANATINLDQSSLTFNVPVSAADPATQTVNLTNTTPATTLNWSATSDQPWLTVAPMSGATTVGTDVLTIGILSHIDQWTTATLAAPMSRDSHTAIWTGIEMIVWGGWGGGLGESNSGHRYNPLTNSWPASVMSTIDAPSPRYYHSAVWTGHEMIIWGGSNLGTGQSNMGGRYNPVTNTWSSTPMSTVNAPTKRYRHSAVWTGTEMIVWGGWGAGALNTGGRYNPTTNTWSPLGVSTTNAPTARDGHIAVWTGAEMIVWGGWNSGLKNTGGRYNPMTDTWSATPTSIVNAPTARQNHSAIWTGSEMIVWGGDTNGTFNGTNTGGRYDPAIDTWSTTATTTVGTLTARHSHSAIWTGNEMIVWGGISGVTEPNDGKRYVPINLTVGTYTGTISVADPAATNTPQTVTVTLTVSGPAINLAPSNLTFTANAGGLDPAAKTVNLTNSGPAGTTLRWMANTDQPWLSVSPGLGITGAGTDVLSVIALFRSSGKWTTFTSVTNAPTARNAPAAIWTGSEMIVWGGNDASGICNTGKRYNPASDTWSVSGTSTTNAAAKRYHHSAVWTGTEMIVWGGIDISGGGCNTGGRYNAGTDTWSAIPMSTVNAPSQRWGHSAVWTGTEMIVWGGLASGSYMNDGWRYNPVTNTWSATPISSVNAPTIRAHHSAIWTGTEMIIWGGFEGIGAGTYVNTGGRYNPVTDSWAPLGISTINAPDGRGWAATIWTGKDLVIWGGSADIGVNNGALYSPSTDTWSVVPIPLDNAPLPRIGFASVWTGSDLIFWGGVGGGVSLNSGKRFQPYTDMAPGTYTGNVNITDPYATNTPQSVTVTFTIDPQAIIANPASLAFGANFGGANPAAKLVNLTNSGAIGATVNWTTSVICTPAGWLSVAPPSGNTTLETDILSVTTDITGLPVGTYNGMVVITDSSTGNTVRTVPVALRVHTPIITLAPASLAFTGIFGGTNPASQTVNLTNTGVAGSTLTWTAPATCVPAGWLSVSPGSGTTTGETDVLTASVNITGLSVGTYTGTITVTDPGASNNPQTISVTLTISVLTINLDQTSLTFNAGVEGPNPAAQTVNVTNPTPATTLLWAAGTTKPWFYVSPFSGVTTVGTSALTVQAVASQTEAWLGSINSTGAPTARSVQTAVWTGKGMIVWGGASGSGPSTFHNDGKLYDPASNTWTTTTSTVGAPLGRYAHTAVWTGTEMIIWGGLNASTPLNTGGRYNPVNNTWTSMSTIGAPLARDHHTAIWTGSEMIVWGGSQGATLFNSGGRYNPVTDTWTGATTLAGAPTARISASAVWSGSEMIIWGGSNGIYVNSTTYNTGARYNPTTNTWTGTTATLNAPLNRTSHRAIWTGTEMLIWGGYDGGSWRNAGARYNPATDTWLGATPSVGAPPIRTAHSAVWTGREMIIWGGYDGISYLSDGARYQPPIHLAAGTYTDTLTVSDPAAANNPQTVNLTLTVVAPTVHLDVPELAFTAPTAGPNPSAQTANLTNPGPAGSRLNWTASSDRPWITVTATNGLTTSGTSALSVQPLLTQTELWTGATSLVGVPATRTGACTVWTGKEMIVWAGQGSTGFLDTGGRYNPVTNSWVAMTTTNAPGARTYVSAVWTGKEMVIWGGYNGTQLPDGARYNPFTDTWSIGLSNTNRPTARYGHTAVWSGTEMLVWGGNGGGGPLIDGKRYNPVTDTWTGSIATTAAPAARSFHSAVWTGSEMIVWGGKVGTTVNTGGRYNPATNTWTGSTTTTGAPVARSAQTAVWTGSEMVVWGGDNGLGTLYHNTGALYNPVTDTWTGATSLAGALSARGGQCAVWTSASMVVWGGYASGTYRQDGAQYQPAFNLAAGVYSGTITVADPVAAENPQTVSVRLYVSNSANTAPTVSSAAWATPDPVFEANTTSVSVTASDGDAGPAPLTYTWWKISGPGAVTFSPNGTTGSDTATATFGASGTYDLGVSISDGASIVTDSITGIVVTLNPVTVNVGSLTFTAFIGATTPVSQTITVTNTSGSSVTVTLSDADAWLSQTFGGGAPVAAVGSGGSATFTVTVNPTGLNGTYTGTLTITNTPSGSTQTIPITFTVSAAPPKSGGKKSGCAVSSAPMLPASEWVAGLGLCLLLAGFAHRRV